jgi:hypothetical protein
MARSYDYAVVKISPDPIRDEALNVAVAVLRPDRIDICLTPSPERLRAVAPSLHREALEELSASIRSVDAPNLSTTERIERLRHLPGISVSGPATLYGETDAELEGHVQALVSRLLTAVRAPAAAPPPKVTRLTKELAVTFRREKLLARGEEGLERHKIVRNVPVSTDGKLRADFVAKNRKMHVTETVDLRMEGDLTASRMKDIAVAAVTLDEAKRTFGRSTQRYFLYAANASAERQARGYLEAARHHTEYTFNFASRDDRATYLDFIYSALRGDLAGAARISIPASGGGGTRRRGHSRSDK